MKSKKGVLIFFAAITTLVLILIILITSAEKIDKDELENFHEDTNMPELRFGLDITRYKTIEGTIEPGDYFGGLISKYGVSMNTIHDMAELSDTIFDLRRLRSGNSYTILQDTSDCESLRWFIYHIDRVNYVMFDFSEPLNIIRGVNEIDTISNIYSGVIASSLWNTMINDNMNPNLILSLSDIFAWVVDFYAIQRGDKFKIIYDDLFVEEESIGIGRIHAAWFKHMGKEYYAFYYMQDSIMTYFDEEGNSVRRQFLKAPLQFSRISSGFSHSRFHPILRTYRPHHGVDYVAPAGTPVRTVGDGTVIDARYAGGAGNMVRVRHNSVYTTTYMHLRGFAPGIRRGVRVAQGDIIGYVGSTGLSTGPHLDFRVHKNGVAVNPLTVESPPAEPIHPENLKQYLKDIEPVKKKLDRIKTKKLSSI